jgi:hypothetical protein
MLDVSLSAPRLNEKKIPTVQIREKMNRIVLKLFKNKA